MSNNKNNARDLAIDIGRAISLQRQAEAFSTRRYYDECQIGEHPYWTVVFTGVSEEAHRWLTELLNSPITRGEWLQSS
jgi:hypothetical protein